MNHSRTIVMQAGRRGFSLIEVLLAVGIFAFAILTMLGLLAPTLGTVNEVINTAEVGTIATKVNSEFQQNARLDEDVLGIDFFDAAVTAMQGGVIELFAFETPLGGDENNLILNVMAKDDQGAALGFQPFNLDFLRSEGRNRLYRAVISASSTNPPAFLLGSGDGQFFDTVNVPIGNENVDVFSFASNASPDYPMGYLGLNVRIYLEPLPPPTGSWQPDQKFSEANLILEYNTAVSR